jgi:hypothetical protein
MSLSATTNSGGQARIRKAQPHHQPQPQMSNPHSSNYGTFLERLWDAVTAPYALGFLHLHPPRRSAEVTQLIGVLFRLATACHIAYCCLLVREHLHCPVYTPHLPHVWDRLALSSCSHRPLMHAGTPTWCSRFKGNGNMTTNSMALDKEQLS